MAMTAYGRHACSASGSMLTSCAVCVCVRNLNASSDVTLHPLMQMMKADNLNAMATERDREVRNILQSINDLAQIMKDLSVLVIDQGTILDRIDYNMEQVCKRTLARCWQLKLGKCFGRGWSGGYIAISLLSVFLH